MWGRVCAVIFFAAAGCGAVPDIRFADAEAGASDAGAGNGGDGAPSACQGALTGGAQCCGTTICLDREDPGHCNCADCLQMGCAVVGEICCVDSQGTLGCKPNLTSCH